jgi:hypothetical protein
VVGRSVGCYLSRRERRRSRPIDTLQAPNTHKHQKLPAWFQIEKSAALIISLFMRTQSLAGTLWQCGLVNSPISSFCLCIFNFIAHHKTVYNKCKHEHIWHVFYNAYSSHGFMSSLTSIINAWKLYLQSSTHFQSHKPSATICFKNRIFISNGAEWAHWEKCSWNKVILVILIYNISI